MKSKRKKRILATILCMVMVLTSNISLLAEDAGALNTETSIETEVPETEQPKEPEQKPEEPEQKPEAPEEKPEAPEEKPEVPEEKPEVPEQKPETPEEKPEASEQKPEQPEQKPEAPEQKPEQPEQKPEAPEQKPEQPEQKPEAPEEEKPVLSEKVELKKEFRDADGKLVQKITAKLPKGAFEAENSAITMEVEKVKGSSEDYMKKLMTESLSEGKELGDYFLYKIEFKVNGKKMESLEPIEITFAKSDFEIKDVKDVNVFYFEPKDPQAGRTEDEIIEIVQRKELVKNLQAAGKSTADLDEKYDVSSVEVKENQRTGKIVLEGRKSTIYGCYVEKEPEKETPEEETGNPEETPIEIPGLSYEDDGVVIQVTSEEEGVIPEGAELQVRPITAEKETKAQYEEVEKKIRDKVAEEEKEVAGFLAYDITFVDKEGNELEPNGKVKVSMNYKKAEIPKEVVEQEVKDTEVTVFHLEEDEKGEVKDVVDMGAKKTAKVDTLITTEGQKVRNVEAETESFSVFAVTWEAQAVEDRAIGEYVYKAVWEKNSRNPRTATIHFRNANGQDISQELGVTEDKTIYVNENSDLGTTIGKDLNGIGDQYSGRPDNKDYDYIFKEARLNSTRGTIANDISYNPDDKQGYKWFYSQNGSWEGWTGKRVARDVDVYLIYEKKNRQNNVDEITTIKDENIHIDLFNYNAKINDSRITPGVSSGFKFHSNVESYDGKNYLEEDDKYTNPHNQVIQQDYVKCNLKNNYPELTDGTSLGYLFGHGSSEAVTSYNGLSGLLYKDAEGYNVYDSEQYHAQLLSDEERIAVYKARLSPDWKTFNYGNFLPFNELPYDARNNTNNSVLGKRFNSDMWFGMNIGFTFIQPKNGLVNDNPMVFDFRGDDDVWVFIDGVKVLDIGGIHDRKEGSIDFSTGRVKVEGKEDTTLAALYRAAYVEKNGERGVNDYLSSIFKKDANGEYTTYKNFGGHNFEFFYLERGGGAANCRIRFNMPSIDPDDIIVRKEIENYDEGAYSDVEFSFELYVNDALQKGEKYTLTKADGTEVLDQYTDSEGRFKLKHGESAKFSQYEQGSRYYVKEVGISSETYDHVTIESSGIVNENDQDISQGENSIQSKELVVGDNPTVTFLNRCALSNMKHLIVEKVLKSGTSEEPYNMRVTVGGELYNGSYKIGKDYESAMAEKEQNTENGIISLKANQVAVVLGNVSRTDNGTIKRGIPSGTSFKVEELLKDNGQYLEPTYEIVKDTADAGNIQNGFEDTGFAEGKIALKANAKVVVTNSYNATLSVEKVWKPSAPSNIDGVYVGVYQQNDGRLVPVADQYQLLKSDEWKYTFVGLEGDISQYVVKELYSTKDTQGDFQIDGKNYVGVEEGGNVTFDGKKYTVNYSEKSEEGNKTVTITNSATWQIVKVSKNLSTDGKKLKLEGAEFIAHIVQDGASKPGTSYYGRSEEAGVVKWYETYDSENKEFKNPLDNLPSGNKYLVTETKAPSGYQVGEYSWEIDLKGSNPIVKCNNSTIESEMLDGITTYCFENTPVYNLPSTGGNGIFQYIISGTLLMMAAGILMLYKMKRKGVLES